MSRSDKRASLQQAVTELRQPAAPSVAGQLRAARYIALAQEKRQRSWLSWLWSRANLPVWGGAALAGLGAVAIAIIFFMQPETSVVQPAVQANAAHGSGSVLLEDLSIMAAQDDLQFYQDIELLQWLAEEGELDAQG